MSVWALKCQRPGCECVAYALVEETPTFLNCRFTRAELVYYTELPDGGRAAEIAIDLSEVSRSPLLRLPNGTIRNWDAPCAGVPRMEDPHQASTPETIDLTQSSSGDEEGDSDTGSCVLQEVRNTLRRTVRVRHHGKVCTREEERSCPSQEGNHRRAKRSSTLGRVLRRHGKAPQSYGQIPLRSTGTTDDEDSDHSSVRDPRDW